MKKVLKSLNISKALAATFVIGLLSVPSMALASMSCPLLDCDVAGGVVTIEAGDSCDCIAETIEFNTCQLRLKDGASCFIGSSEIEGAHFTILGQTGVPEVDIDDATMYIEKFVLKNVDALVNDSFIVSDTGVSSAGNRTGHRVRIFNTEIVESLFD